MAKLSTEPQKAGILTLYVSKEQRNVWTVARRIVAARYGWTLGKAVHVALKEWVERNQIILPEKDRLDWEDVRRLHNMP